MSIPKLAFLLAFFPWLAGAAPFSGTTVDKGDYYLYGETQIPLLRAVSEIAVRFGPGTEPAAALQRVREVLGDPTAAFVQERLSEKRGLFSIYNVADAESAGPLLRADAAVNYVTPVFVHQARVTPEDSVVVALKDGYVLADVSDALDAAGLVFEESLIGLPLYIFRLKNPLTSDALSTALAAGQVAGIRFAEPDFFVEYQIQPPSPVFTFMDILPWQDPGVEVLVTSSEKPAVRITSKKVAASRSTVEIAGVATGEVAAVTYQSNRTGKVGVALGTSAWKFTAKLKRGRNVFLIAADGPGGKSAPARVVVTAK